MIVIRDQARSFLGFAWPSSGGSDNITHHLTRDDDFSRINFDDVQQTLLANDTNNGPCNPG
jgi:hypothetical protein